MTKTRVSVSDPGDFLSVVPVLLGFEPDSGDVVMTGLDERGRVAVSMRFPQPQPDELSMASLAPILSNIIDAGVRSVMLTAYGPGQQVTPAVDKLLAVVGPVLEVRDAFRVEGGRYWSYACQDVDCCPIEGRTFQAETQATTTLRVEAGMSAETSRSKVAGRFAAPTGERADAARAAWTQAQAKPLSLPEGRAAVDQAVADCREGKPFDASKAAQLAQAMTALPVRDHAWSLMTPEHAEAHTGLWSEVLRRVPPEASAAPASLLAFSAWQTGNGALGHLALDRAFEADPDYSMARLLDGALSAGLPPSAAVLPMTPADVEQSYREQGYDYDTPELDLEA